MTISKNGYRAYLEDKGFVKSTISSYCSAINHFSKKMELDVWSVSEVEPLNSLIKKLDWKGEYQSVGSYGNTSIFNAINHWRDYVIKERGSVSATPDRSVYLLSGAPINDKGQVSKIYEGVELTWSCNKELPKLDDQVFWLRLSESAPGLVASGKVISHNESGDSVVGKQSSYVTVRLDDVREKCSDGLIPMTLIRLASQDFVFPFLPRAPCVLVPSPLGDCISAMWDFGRGVHSLAQCANWFRAQPNWDNGSWKPHYQSRVGAIKAISDGRAELDEETLDWLWREGENGICSVMPGQLATVEYERNFELLRELATQIIQDPSRATYQQVFTRWEAAKRDGLFRQTYAAVLHRVFATVAPSRYTTLVNVQHCRTLLDHFNRDFELSTADSRDWLELNYEIKKAMKEAGLPDSKPIDNNMVAWMLFSEVNGTLLKKTDDLLSSVQQSDCKEPLMTSHEPLNQILFGPPGTGKTYYTINKALAILEPELLSEPGVTRDELKAAFDRYQQAGQVAFVTFHQSFSYEDFVEGIRAITRDDGALEYKVESGVFAKLCEQASRGVTATEDCFEQSLRLLREQTEQAEDNLLLMHTTKGKPFKACYSGDKTFLIYPASNPGLSNGYSANMEHVRALYQTGEKAGYNTSYVWGMLDYLKQHCQLPAEYQAPERGERKPFVLIIDEINRGNVSRIFGELITLIEPSKRTGASEALTTTLPYSKRPFSVPDNLYLIGTMNTADRSLAGLDIALRRRFVFEEMPPRAELLDGVVIEEEGHKVDVGCLLHTLNQRIEVLLDRDHCLGHAYFMPLKAASKPTLAQLGDIFQHQILPLLQEYFFEDWQRIAWVLNDHRKSKAEAMFLEAPKLELKTLLGDIAVGGQRQRWSINEKAFRRIEAYVLTIEGDKGAQ